MVKSAFISVISEKERRGSVEFQVFRFTNKSLSNKKKKRN
uniref:Ribosomal protein S15 n=1 Tax=Desmidorchis retrospiciens TaxID=197251 RepID=A0AB38ZH94_9GENT